MGRTGKVWGYQNFDVEPDVITSAKVGAVIITCRIHQLSSPYTLLLSILVSYFFQSCPQKSLEVAIDHVSVAYCDACTTRDGKLWIKKNVCRGRRLTGCHIHAVRRYVRKPLGMVRCGQVGSLAPFDDRYHSERGLRRVKQRTAVTPQIHSRKALRKTQKSSEMKGYTSLGK